jgi:hypothetical protein
MTERNCLFCRFAPNRFGISLVVGFVSLDAAGSARKPASPWIIGFVKKPKRKQRC